MSTMSTLPREILEAPFPEGLIKSRPGAFGGSLSYLEGHTIIGRLNDAFEGAWSFEIMSHQILDEEVLVLGKFRCELAGVIKMAFGTSKITRDSRSGQALNLGDDLKAAATDALKKAATLLGVGLYLFAGNNNREPVRETGWSTGKPRVIVRNDRDRMPFTPGGANDNDRITQKQLAAIFAISHDREMSTKDIRDLSREMFGRMPDYLTKAEASRLIETLLAR